MEFYYLRIGLQILSLVLLGYYYLRENQDSKENWATFFSGFWVLISIIITNRFCVHFGFWEFTGVVDGFLKMPIDLFYLNVLICGLLPFIINKGKRILMTTTILIVVECLFVVFFYKISMLNLTSNYWLLPFIISLLIVLIPSQIWSSSYYYSKNLSFRSSIQIIVMGIAFLYLSPLMAVDYFEITLSYSLPLSFLFHGLLFVSTPGLIAVYDLAQKGLGTPFPYDKTKKLIRNGVYGYTKNPIQISFILCFLVMAVFFYEPFFLGGIIVSLFFIFSISLPDEKQKMNVQFGKEWTSYRCNIPSWYFLYKPIHHPKGVLLFQPNCHFCTQLMNWFHSKKGVNLEIEYMSLLQLKEYDQITYLDYLGNEYRGILAIAHAFEHINLFFALFAWSIRLPGIHHIIQFIIDGTYEENC